MRIISKTHDYYDAIQSHGFDSKIVYLRNSYCIQVITPTERMNLRAVAKEPKAPTLKSLLRQLRAATPGVSYLNTEKGEVRVMSGWVLFAGKFYPFVLVQPVRFSSFEQLVASTASVEEIFYSMPELTAYLKKLGHTTSTRYPGLFDDVALKKISAFFSLAESDRHLEQCLALKLANAVYHPSNPDQVTVDGVLRPLKFFKVKEPWQAYQELAMFFGNIGTQENPTPIPEKYRIQQHGFDEWSFKKLPTKRR